MLCMTALKLVSPWRFDSCFRFAVAASEIVTVIKVQILHLFPSGGLSEEPSEKSYGLFN